MSIAATVAHPFNPAKLLWHRSQVEAVLAGHTTSAPINLEWDLSNTCPHDCFFCSFGTSESHGYRQQVWQVFPVARARTLIPELKAAGVQAITFTGGGEPLMHPEAADLFARTTGAGLQWGLVTNGVLLRGEVREQVAWNARFVRISLDAGTDATHQIMHRPKTPQFDLILDNLAATTARARELGTPLQVGASFCVTDDNWQEIGLAAAKVKARGGAYLEVRPTFPTDWRGDGLGMALSNVTAAIDALEDARRDVADRHFQIIGMIDRFASLAAPAKGYSTCQIGGLMSVLGADGRLWHCCVQRGQDGFALGSVLHVPFAEAWRAAQQKRLQDVIDVKKCPRCRYDNYNKLLEGMQTDALHAAFV